MSIWSNTLATYAGPVLGSLPVQAVNVGLVIKALEPIWQTRSETASRLRGRIESVLDWATARGYRKGLVTVEASDPIGSPEKPLTNARLEAKFRDCADNDGEAAVGGEFRRATGDDWAIGNAAGCAGVDDAVRWMMQWNFAALHGCGRFSRPRAGSLANLTSGQLKKRAGRKSASSALCRPRTISSATAAPRNGDIVTPLWVMAI
jgi:hypothetical protein